MVQDGGAHGINKEQMGSSWETDGGLSITLMVSPTLVDILFYPLNILLMQGYQE